MLTSAAETQKKVAAKPEGNLQTVSNYFKNYLDDIAPQLKAYRELLAKAARLNVELRKVRKLAGITNRVKLSDGKTHNQMKGLLRKLLIRVQRELRALRQEMTKYAGIRKLWRTLVKCKRSTDRALRVINGTCKAIKKGPIKKKPKKSPRRRKAKKAKKAKRKAAKKARKAAKKARKAAKKARKAKRKARRRRRRRGRKAKRRRRRRKGKKARRRRRKGRKAKRRRRRRRKTKIIKKT